MAHMASVSCWIIPEKIHNPPRKEIFTIQKGGRGMGKRVLKFVYGCLEREKRGIVNFLPVGGVGGGSFLEQLALC